jgi:hypothetical protein
VQAVAIYFEPSYPHFIGRNCPTIFRTSLLPTNCSRLCYHQRWFPLMPTNCSLALGSARKRASVCCFLSALVTSPCALRSRGPEQKTLRREFTSVGRTNVASLNGGSLDGAAPGESCGRSGRAVAGRETAADPAVSFRGNSLPHQRPVLTSPCPETTPSPSGPWRRWPGVCRRG